MPPDIVADVLAAIASANPDRNKLSLDRRSLKLIEELGEIAEAFLNVTSKINEKKKTWEDVREEAADVLIITADIAMTPLHEDDDASSKLHRYVCDNLHRINMGFHTILGRLSRLNASYGDVYQNDAPSAHQYAAELVRYAFALNYLVNDDPKQLLVNVQRKIKKWKRKRSG